VCVCVYMTRKQTAACLRPVSSLARERAAQGAGDRRSRAGGRAPSA